MKFDIWWTLTKVCLLARQDYLKEGKLPDWEVPNMLAKYYTTTAALDLAKSKTK